MKTLAVITLGSAMLALAAPAAEDLLDRVGEQLTFSAPNGSARLKLSGIVDLEYYDVSLPAPGTLFTEQSTLFNPRVSLFADAQLGTRVYFFAQARIDHGFDPSDDGDPQVRLDECAIRLALGDEGKCSIQVGKFATVVGNWVPRHDSWENPFVTAPLPYENLTAVWHSTAARSLNQLLAWAHIRPPGTPATEYADKYLRLPMIWGPSYTTGMAGFGRMGKFDAAIEVKNASLSSRPPSWDPENDQWAHPTFSGRVGWRPNAMWNVGLSGSTGTYLDPSATPTLAPGH
ncbi:MAG TPA: hypothetical protein VFJ90_11030, partial [Candidatus Didemnitutus sp.]|nr:hypothetical protein [Candidatus Didemnitutus sp.]